MKNQFLRLPIYLRKKLKAPLGKLIPSKDIKKINFKNRTIICVGDVTTKNILKKGISPKICIYDGKVMRRGKKISNVIKKFKAIEIHVDNPKGFLNREIFNVIDKGLKLKSNLKIFVDGEEDLTTLAAIHLSPKGTTVLYGQPNEGLVLVNVNGKIKSKVKKILSSMNQ